LKLDPEYAKISKHFHENPDELADAFADAWFKLLHRDMGPVSRYLGSEVPAETKLWQDPLPERGDYTLSAADIETLKAQINNSDLGIAELVRTAWASASTYRNSDKRGGANGARIRLAPQKDWEVNNPQELDKVLNQLEAIQKSFDKKVSMADLIVLAGCSAIEQAANAAGYAVDVPFTPGRVDADDEHTDADSFALLEPLTDGFRNYAGNNPVKPAEVTLVDRAQLLSLTAPEMTVLIGGLRVLDANTNGVEHGVLTDKKETLSNDFFVNLLDMGTSWSATSDKEEVFEGKDRASGKVKWTGTRNDLVFGSNSILRSIAEVYASEDANEKFVKDFIAAWDKVMNLDRFDLT